MALVEIESRNVGRIIGPRGATIRQLQADYNVNISISKEDDANGNRYVEITGSVDADIQRAVTAIHQRFTQSGGFRGRDSGRPFNNNNLDRQPNHFNQYNAPRQGGYQNNSHTQSFSNNNDWDTPPPQVPHYVPKKIKAEVDDEWDAPQYKPSANTYQQSNDSSSFNNSYISQDRSRFNSSYRGNRGNRESFGGGYKQNESRSNYSSDNKIPYRSYDDPPEIPISSVKQEKEEFVPIDWDKANAEADLARKKRWAKCPILVKDFYMEHPEVTNTTEEEVEKFRIENKNIVVARTFAEEGSAELMPKPTTKFEHAFEKFPDLMNEIKKAGFEKPSPIQSQMWPILLQGEDCIGIAQTGTGKTLAFLLPALIHTDGQPHDRGVAARGGPNVLVLAPTRELAIQIEKEVAKYQFRGIRAVCIYGGNDRKKQIEVVESGVEIIIATPGRLNDLVAAGHIKIESITYLILDEADRMLDMGFEPQIRKLLLDIRDDRQTVMTSATWPAGVRRLASSYMKNPFQVFIGSLDLAATHTVTQKIEIMDEEEKFFRICHFVLSEMKPEDKAMIFCGKKDRADSLSCEFALKGIECQCIHGNRDQSDREQALADIKSGEVRILIATDVASRGIDIEDITYVVNYDFPRNIEEYVHRVGRTGRANRLGTSLSFMTRQDWGSAAELIAILEEADQEVLPELQEMAKRFAAKKDRDRNDRGSGRGGFRGGNRGGGGGGGYRGGHGHGRGGNRY